MNNTQIVSKIIRFTIVSLILGLLMQSLAAQTKKDEPKKSKTRVEVKIIKEDEKGNITRIDTAYEVTGDESPKVIVKKIEGGTHQGKSGKAQKEIKVRVISEGEVTDTLEKEIETTFMIDGDMMEAGEFPGDLEWRSATPCHQGCGHNTYSMPCCPEASQWDGNMFPFRMGMSPWGRITKFEIKEKKHGKVIRIETNDDGMMMCPPPPPPPLPGHMEKKVIRIKDGGNNTEGNEKVIIMEKKGKPEIDRNE